MLTSRVALIVIRLILVCTAVFYAVLKVFSPGPTPLILKPAAVHIANAPSQTNPAWSQFTIVLIVTIGVLVIYATVRDMLSDRKAYGEIATFSEPGTIALIWLFALTCVYRWVVSMLLGAQWFYAGTLAILMVGLAIYEGRQYASNHL